MTADLLELATRVAVEAGELATLRRAEGVEVAATKSSLVDVVTAADREVEALIRRRIQDARPGDGFYGEESDAAVGTSGLTWVVDPIDGTVNYLYGIPRWAVSVAVVEAPTQDPDTWTALAGCVVDPSHGDVYRAAVGAGATLGGRALRASRPASLATSLLGTGFGYDAAIRREQADAVARAIGEVRDIRRAGAAALDLCDVARGRLDAYAERGVQPWDYAAAALIASEAGAVVHSTDLREGRRLVTAAAPAIAHDFAKLVRDAGF